MLTCWSVPRCPRRPRPCVGRTRRRALRRHGAGFRRRRAFRTCRCRASSSTSVCRRRGAPSVVRILSVTAAPSMIAIATLGHPPPAPPTDASAIPRRQRDASAPPSERVGGCAPATDDGVADGLDPRCGVPPQAATVTHRSGGNEMASPMGSNLRFRYCTSRRPPVTASNTCRPLNIPTCVATQIPHNCSPGVTSASAIGRNFASRSDVALRADSRDARPPRSVSRRAWACRCGWCAPWVRDWPEQYSVGANLSVGPRAPDRSTATSRPIATASPHAVSGRTAAADSLNRRVHRAGTRPRRPSKAIAVPSTAGRAIHGVGRNFASRSGITGPS